MDGDGVRGGAMRGCEDIICAMRRFGVPSPGSGHDNHGRSWFRVLLAGNRPNRADRSYREGVRHSSSRS